MDRDPHARHLDLTDSDSQILFGVELEQLHTVNAGHGQGTVWKRTLQHAGVADELTKVGIYVDQLPDHEITAIISPDATKIGSISVAVDVATQLVTMFQDQRADDERYEKTSRRWRDDPGRVSGYVPGDAGSIRWTLLPPQLFAADSYQQTRDERVNGIRLAAAQGAAWAYMATPHFIPAGIALDVVTAVPPSPAARAELRLPARYVMVFHDGIPIELIAGSDEALDQFAGDSVLGDRALVIGGILSANDDGTLYQDHAYLILARPSALTGVYGWQTIAVTYGEHAAGRVLYNYAGLLSWETWTAPPALPTSPRGKAGSGNQLKKAAKSPEAQAGGYHGVHVLDYRPPPVEAAPESPTVRGDDLPSDRPRRERRYQGTRRGYWSENKRYGIRDDADRLIGAVYGPDAVEGVTFIRRRRFIRHAVTRPDLPPPPTRPDVYRVPADTCPR